MEIINSTAQNMASTIESVQTILNAIGENPKREGLRDTPTRYMKFLREFTEAEEFNMTTFKNEGIDQMILQSDIPFFSLCEHHLVPFFGKGAIAYIPDKKIVGLSKLARTLEKFSRSLQNQERITQQTADFLMDTLKPRGVAVLLKARHLCIEMRGVKKHDTCTTTSVIRGEFEDRQVLDEFYNLIKLRGNI